MIWNPTGSRKGTEKLQYTCKEETFPSDFFLYQCMLEQRHMAKGSIKNGIDSIRNEGKEKGGLFSFLENRNSFIPRQTD